MKTTLRFLGLLVALDGVLSAVFGHAFLRFLQRRLPTQLHFVLKAFERVPLPLFRAGAVAQALIGGHLLYHGSLRTVRRRRTP